MARTLNGYEKGFQSTESDDDDDVDGLVVNNNDVEKEDDGNEELSTVELTPLCLVDVDEEYCPVRTDPDPDAVADAVLDAILALKDKTEIYSIEYFP